MDGWYIRPSSQGQHLLTWSTDSITTSVSSPWSTALIRLAKFSTTVVVVIGAGLLYFEYLHRLKMIKRQEARQRRLVRKLLERQMINTDPVPIFNVQNSRKLEKMPSPDCQYRRSYSRHDPSGQRKMFPTDLVSRNQLYRVWGAVPPASQLRQERRRFNPGRIARRPHVERDIKYRDIDRGDPDGGEDETKKSGSNHSDDPSMEKVIQSAKEVRRLIRNSSTDSFNYYDSQPSSIETAVDDIAQYDEEYSEDNQNQDYTSKTNSDFRELLQLTSIDDNWSDTGSIRHSSVISCSPSREMRRQSVLSCRTGDFLDLESWDWEGEAPMELGVETNQSMDLVIRCGEIVTSDTNIKMARQ